MIFVTVRVEAPRRRGIAVALAAAALLLAHALFMCVLGLPGVSGTAEPVPTLVAAEKSLGATTHADPATEGHEQGCLARTPQREAEHEVGTTTTELDSADAQADTSRRPRFAGWGPWRIAAPDGRGILRDLCIDRC
ncbi:hypothetical protein NONI108955_09380 [Nocardia ninae]